MLIDRRPSKPSIGAGLQTTHTAGMGSTEPLPASSTSPKVPAMAAESRHTPTPSLPDSHTLSSNESSRHGSRRNSIANEPRTPSPSPSPRPQPPPLAGGSSSRRGSAARRSFSRTGHRPGHRSPFSPQPSTPQPDLHTGSSDEDSTLDVLQSTSPALPEHEPVVRHRSNSRRTSSSPASAHTVRPPALCYDEPTTLNDARASTASPSDELHEYFKFSRTLGEGAFAKVKLATHVESQIRVAVKIIDKAAIKEDYIRNNLHREGNLLKILAHKHIVNLFQIIETENQYCLVTELAERGEILEYIVAHGPLNEKEARKYIRQMISAVDFMHQSKVVHRDLKAENLLLDHDLNLKIVDLGLGNSIADKDFLRTQCGSPAYSAPELLGGKKYNEKVDIWSIGVNLYAMLTGKLPFPSHNVTTLHALILDQAYDVPDHFSPELVDLLSRILTAKPKDRICMSDLRAHPWIIAGGPMSSEVLEPRREAKDLDDDVIHYMCNELAYTRDEVVEAVLDERFDSTHGCYNILMIEKRRVGRPGARRDAIMAQRQQRMRRSQTEGHLAQSHLHEGVMPRRGSDRAADRGPRRIRRLSLSQPINLAKEDTVHQAGQAGNVTQTTTQTSRSSARGRHDVAPRAESPGYRRNSLSSLNHLRRTATTNVPTAGPVSRRTSDSTVATATSPSSEHQSGGDSRHQRLSDMLHSTSPRVRSGSLTISAHRPRRNTGTWAEPASAHKPAGTSSNGHGHGTGGAEPLPSIMRPRTDSLSRLSRQPSSPVSAGNVDSERPLKVNAMRYPLSQKMVSAKDPREIFGQLLRALEHLGLVAQAMRDPMLAVRATKNDLVLEAEVVKVPQLSLHGIHFKRLRGETYEHREICTRLIDLLDM